MRMYESVILLCCKHLLHFGHFLVYIKTVTSHINKTANQYTRLIVFSHSITLQLLTVDNLLFETSEHINQRSEHNYDFCSINTKTTYWIIRLFCTITSSSTFTTVKMALKLPITSAQIPSACTTLQASSNFFSISTRHCANIDHSHFYLHAYTGYRVPFSFCN